MSIDTGEVISIPATAVSSNGADFIAATDVRDYDWISVNIGNSVYVGTLTFQGTFDASDATSWVGVSMIEMSGLDGSISNSVAQNALNTAYAGPVRYPYFRVRMTAYTSGTAIGAMELRKGGKPGFALLTISSYLIASKNKIGITRNDGVNKLAIASGTSADTVIMSAPGFLSHILVTTTNTNRMLIYDNASAGSGDIIATIPANTPADTIIDCKATGESGVTVKGNANNPAITAFYSYF